MIVFMIDRHKNATVYNTDDLAYSHFNNANKGHFNNHVPYGQTSIENIAKWVYGIRFKEKNLNEHFDNWKKVYVAKRDID